jgi:hypothetical protein
MDQFLPNKEFADRVMVQVRLVHERQQRSLMLVEKLLNMLPIRGLMVAIAVLGALWNLARIGIMLSPALCR